MADEAFSSFVDSLWSGARAAGVSRETFSRAFKDVTADPEVLEKAEHQPEFVKPIWDYLESAVSDKRIQNGREQLARYKQTLDAIEQKYNVDRSVVVAIWGMETSYGSFTGDRNVIRSLATLAYKGSRQDFGRQQLIAALKILQKGDIAPERMMGSWAGAMGHTQFIPTTYEAHAVDFTGDGKRDIWNSIPDALASTANYLKASGWRFGETWGYEVEIPKGFDHALANPKLLKTLKEWDALGVKRVRGLAYPRPDDQAALILPAGASGAAFLALNNFRTILRYNNATAYALAVGHLSDRIRGFGPFVRSWPVGDAPLARSERMELQQHLARKGLLNGEIDGIIGSGTMEAVRAFQKSKGLTVDGYAGQKLLEILRRDS
ncbi:MAG: lytic murein transglycosylase [Pseudomonadota bacterium]|nr:lytic murein transglycosylase [Pseudomonadota bacterium]